MSLNNSSDKCVIPYCVRHSTGHLAFCLNHTNVWVQSSERTEIDWTSDESYDSAVHKFVQRMMETSVEDIVIANHEEAIAQNP